MSWKSRVATAAVLVACIAGAPLVLAQCAASCLTHGDVAASVPSCHHAPANHLRIGSASNPCHHDHHGPALGGPSGPPAAARAFDTILAVVPTAAPSPDAGVAWFVWRLAPPGSHTTPLTLSLPLRI